MKAILGKKIGMTQLFQDEKVVPITLLEAGPCAVLQVKTKEKDGYEAFQVGFVALRKSRRKKTNRGKEFMYVREFRVGKETVPESGATIDVTAFQEGDIVEVSGISKGKGFQGGVKRHGFSGRNATHGVKHEQRTIGSTGTSNPEHVIKGKRMPGRMGADRVTVKNLKIVNIDKEHNILAVRGAVPGPRGALVEIRG